MFTPHPNFFHPGSRAKKDFGSRIRIRIKELKYFNPKISFYALGNMIRDVHPGSGSIPVHTSHARHCTRNQIENSPATAGAGVVASGAWRTLPYAVQPEFCISQISASLSQLLIFFFKTCGFFLGETLTIIIIHYFWSIYIKIMTYVRKGRNAFSKSAVIICNSAEIGTVLGTETPPWDTRLLSFGSLSLPRNRTVVQAPV
jgi:hypothetical protein